MGAGAGIGATIGGGFGRGIGQSSQGMTSAPGGGSNAAASQSSQSAAPTGTLTGSLPDFMKGTMQNAMTQMGSQQRGTMMGDGSEVFSDGRVYAGPMSGTPAHSSTPPPGVDPQQFRPTMSLGGLGRILGGGFGGGGFDPVAGSGNRFFSRAASPARPFQPFDVNRETPAQYQAASYEPNTIANQVASGYRQVFGRDADAGGMGYYANALGNQPRTQAEVNRHLLGGATGADVGAGADYALSLTGGRPELYDTSKVIGTDSAGKPQYEYRRQFKQPVYQPTYSNYSMNRGFYSPGYSMGRSLGMNPFSYNYAVGGNVYADDNNEEDQGIAGLLGK